MRVSYRVSPVYGGNGNAMLLGYGVFIRCRRIDKYPGINGVPSYHNTRTGAVRWAKENLTLIASLYSRGLSAGSGTR